MRSDPETVSAVHDHLCKKLETAAGRLKKRGNTNRFIWVVPDGVKGDIDQLVTVLAADMDGMRVGTKNRELKRITRAWLEVWEKRGLLLKSKSGNWGFTLRTLRRMRVQKTLQTPKSRARYDASYRNYARLGRATS